MKPRARKTKETITSRVETYFKKHPKASVATAAVALELKPQQVYAALHNLKKSKSISALVKKSRKKGFLSQELMTIHEIGLDRAQEIINLLRKFQ